MFIEESNEYYSEEDEGEVEETKEVCEEVEETVSESEECENKEFLVLRRALNAQVKV